jgi:hypothetical protein
LASVKATSFGSRSAALSCSVSVSLACETFVTNWMASSYSPSPTRVCSRLAKADYISALARDKAQFLSDGIMPASGPAAVLATGKVAGKVNGTVNIPATYTNSFAIAANKLEGFK